MTKKDKIIPARKPVNSRAIFIRVSQELWQKIQAEMKDKELEKPQPIVMAALRKRYGVEIG